VGDRRTKSDVEVAALVADSDIQELTFVTSSCLLHPADEGVESCAGRGVIIIVDAAELEHQCDRRA
jgi:hypothetical protein